MSASLPAVCPLASVGEHLDALRRHRDPAMQAFGRLLAAGAGDTLLAWTEAEVARGTPALAITSALSRFATGGIGSAIAALGNAAGNTDALVEVEAAEFRAHLRQMVAALAAETGRAH